MHRTRAGVRLPAQIKTGREQYYDIERVIELDFIRATEAGALKPGASRLAAIIVRLVFVMSFIVEACRPIGARFFRLPLALCELP